MTWSTLQTGETPNVVRRATRALPRACSFRAGNPEIDTLILATSYTAVGHFRCPVDHPAFVDSGPISDPLFVFPRTSVWIQHDGAPPFHCDPNVVTIYNRGQRYRRRPSSPDGDRSDWFALSDDVAREIASAGDPSAVDAVRPFADARTASNSSLYLRQRILHQRARRGEITALELDEHVFEIALEVIAPHHPPEPRRVRPSAARRHAGLVESVRAELARDAGANISLGDLATVAGTSPFHLCRLFRAQTGVTLRSYRNELRCRLALEDLAMGMSTISAIAHRLGFASHAHFVRVARRLFGDAPGTIRRRLALVREALPDVSRETRAVRSE
jgi:AraC-like DNA-binding protein